MSTTEEGVVKDKRKTGEIHCPHCDKSGFVISKAVYEGFKKVGDALHCSLCGHLFGEDEEIPYVEVESDLPDLFGDVEKEELPDLLGDSSELRFCSYCEEYIVNPFTQRCVRHKREVQATDTCPDFRKKR